jgi:hypothetical protein
MGKLCRFSVVKPSGKRFVLVLRGEVDIKMDHRKMECEVVNWINLA